MTKQEKHECKYDSLIIRKGEDDRTHTTVVRVYVDCSCEESNERSLVTFHDNDVLRADDNFKGWFNSVVTYFISNDYKIKDLR